MQGADFILDSLAKEGIDHLFMVPGGLIDPFLPTLGRQTALTPIVAAQEGGAAYMADGYARASGRFGVALCIGGPGLGNAVTAVAAAQTDGSPLLLLSGEVATDMEGLGEFQDAGSQTLDDVSILKPLTRYSTSIANPRNLPHLLRHALLQLRTEPTGPVHLSLPADSQVFDLDACYRPIDAGLIHARTLAVDAAAATLAHFAQGPDGKPPVRIVMLAGAGIEHARCYAALLNFAQRWSIPVATTLRAKGAFPEDHPLSLGVFGYAGTHHSRLALLDNPPDLLLLLGSGLNERDTMHWALKLRARRTIYVNLSTVVMGAHLTDSCVVGDAGAYLDWLAAHDDRIGTALEDTRAARGHWLAGITAQPRLQDPQHCTSDATPLHPARAISELRTALPRDGIVVIDSGAHRAFAGHYWTAYQPLTYLSATNLGPMGWAIPAAIRAQCARPERRVAVITGDGCMRMQGMEIATAARYRLPIIYLVINNAALGNVWLRAHTLGAVPDELTSLPDHDWATFAKGLGGFGITVSRPEQLAGAFAAALENQGPTVIDVKADKRFVTPVQDWSAACAAWSYHE